MNAVAFFTYIVKLSAFYLVSFMPYTSTELDLGVSQDVSQVCRKMCHKLAKHPLFLMYPQIVYIVRKRTF